MALASPIKLMNLEEDHEHSHKRGFLKDNEEDDLLLNLSHKVKRASAKKNVKVYFIWDRIYYEKE